MATAPGFMAYLTLNGDSSNESVHLRTAVANLQRNLNMTSSVRAGSVTVPSSNSETEEKKGDLVALCTLGLAFIHAGAAKALVDALRATFSAFHNTQLKATLRVRNTQIEITSESLSAEQLQTLIEKINKETELG